MTDGKKEGPTLGALAEMHGTVDNPKFSVKELGRFFLCCFTGKMQDYFFNRLWHHISQKPRTLLFPDSAARPFE